MTEKPDLRVGIIGVLPPPYGGITIHVKRLMDYLISRGVNITLLDEYKGINKIRSNIRYYGGIRKYFRNTNFINHVYHYHSPNRFMRLFLGIISIFGFKTIITLHGEGIKSQYNDHGFLWKLVYTFLIKQISVVICDNKDLRNFIVDQGVSFNKTKIISAFIPPVNKESDIEVIPENILNFYKKYEVTIFAMGWIKFHNGVDLYGLDMILELVERLNKKYLTKIGFVVKLLLSDKQDPTYYKKWIEKANSFKNVLVITEDLEELYPLEKEASIVIRPSCTDGDSVSIRESLFLGTPVITSNAIPRPEGCILFQNRDINNFESTTVNLIEQILNKETINIPIQNNNAEQILKLYHSLT